MISNKSIIAFIRPACRYLARGATVNGKRARAQREERGERERGASAKQCYKLGASQPAARRGYRRTVRKRRGCSEPLRVPSYPIKRGDSARLNAVTNTDGSSFHARQYPLIREGRRGKRRRFSPPPSGREQFDLLSRTSGRERRLEAEGADVDYDRRRRRSATNRSLVVSPINCYVLNDHVATARLKRWREKAGARRKCIAAPRAGRGTADASTRKYASRLTLVIDPCAAGIPVHRSAPRAFPRARAFDLGIDAPRVTRRNRTRGVTGRPKIQFDFTRCARSKRHVSARVRARRPRASHRFARTTKAPSGANSPLVNYA